MATRRRPLHNMATYLSVAILVLLGAACSSTESSADRLQYLSIEELAKESQFAVIGTVVAAEGVWLDSEIIISDLDDPELNPWYGVDDPPSEEYMESLLQPDAHTRYSVQVSNQLAGPYATGDTLDIHLPGGTLDGIKFQTAWLDDLPIGSHYLFFIWEGSEPETLKTTGVDAGVLEPVENGGYLSPDGLIVSADELALLADPTLFD